MANDNSEFRIQNSESNKTSKSSSGAKTMADLMKSVRTTVKTVHKGETIKGTITKLTSHEILVDINAKTEAVVLEKDKKLLRNILSSFKVGDEISVTVLNPESDFGYPVVSLRRHLDDLVWDNLLQLQKSQEPVEVIITEVTKGGYIVQLQNGTSGFLPASHLSSDQTVNTPDLMGKKIIAYVMDTNRQLRKIIFSQRQVLDQESFDRFTKGFKNEQKIKATVSNITAFGIFVSIPVSENKTETEGKYIDGLIHISEISWDKVSNLEELFTNGQKVEAVIIGIDRMAKRIDLSIKRQISDPFGEVSKKYAVDQKVSGIVSKVLSTGISLDLGEDKLEGFIRREKIPPTVTYKVGDKVNATITHIDAKKRKIMLVPVLLEKFVGYK